MRITATVRGVKLSPRSRYGIICTSEISRLGIHFKPRRLRRRRRRRRLVFPHPAFPRVGFIDRVDSFRDVYLGYM